MKKLLITMTCVIETAIAHVGIRGTQPFIVVDPATGEARLFMAAGEGVVEQESDMPPYTVTAGQMLPLSNDMDPDSDVGAVPIDYRIFC